MTLPAQTGPFCDVFAQVKPSWCCHLPGRVPTAQLPCLRVSPTEGSITAALPCYGVARVPLGVVGNTESLPGGGAPPAGQASRDGRACVDTALGDGVPLPDRLGLLSPALLPSSLGAGGAGASSFECAISGRLCWCFKFLCRWPQRSRQLPVLPRARRRLRARTEGLAPLPGP